MVTMSNLIIGMAVNKVANIESVEIFCKSLRLHYDGDVCLITDNNDQTFVDYLKSFNINVIYVKDKVTIEALMYKRWLLPHTVITKQYPDTTNIILSDVRDIIYQADPFPHLSGKELDLSAETKRIQECPRWNCMWIRDMYGEDTLQRVKNNWILCGGLMAGKRDGILKLCELMLEEYKRLKHIFTDQGSLNVFYAEGKLPEATIHHTGDALVATIGHALGVTYIDKDGYLIGNEGIKPAIIHQYDRHPNLQDLLLDRVKKQYNGRVVNG